MVRVRSTALAMVCGVVLAAGAVVGPLASTANAQRMNFGMRGGMGGESKVAASELSQFGKILGLDKSQAEALKNLHQAYDAEYEQASKAMQEKMERLRQEAQDTQDWAAMMKDAGEMAEKFQTKSSELEKSLMSDLKALLTPDQASKWPAVERAHRRNTSLNGGGMPGMGLSGESVDLIKMVEDLKLSKTPEPVAQSLERYESEMDSALVERDAKRKELSEQMSPFGKKDGKPATGGMPDFSKIGEMMTEMRKTGVKVRDINDRFSSQVASSLPEDKREDFTAKYRKEKFPQIYKESYSLKALNAAAAFKDLKEDQKSGIAELASKYKREVEAANERTVRATVDAEKDGGGADMMGGFMRMMNGDQGGDDSELAQAKKAQRKLDTDTLDQLKTILTPEQAEHLPERGDNMFQPGGPRGR